MSPRQLDEAPPRTIIDPHGVVDRLKAGESIKLLRQSNIGSADICLRRAGYDMRPNQPRKSGEARCVGTSYHAGMECHYESRRADLFPATGPEIQEAARRAFEDEAALFDSWATSKEASWKRVVDMLDVYFNGHHFWPESYEVLGVEQEWFLPLSGDWYLKGSIDLVLRGPEGIVLADHKTAGRKWDQKKHLPEKQTQAVLYSWAWWRATGEVPAYFAFDVLTYKGEFDRRRCEVRPVHMEAVLNKAIGYTQVFAAVPPEWLPGNTSSNLCSAVYCDYYGECPLGARLVQAPPSVDVEPGSHSEVGQQEATTEAQ